MRSVRGWIRNLVDGQGPPVGTVDVHALPLATGEHELDLTEHRLGALTVIHLAGSGSRTKADQLGHFGWDMELSPGRLQQDVTPHDPQTEYRKRFPDESSQIGKAYISDLERLGWAGGKDHLIWDAVFDGNRPTAAQWSTDPGISASFGNWSCGGVGTGADAGRVVVRKGIAMLGGVVFSIEMGDLMVPVTGEPAMSPNGTSQDRWDLVCLRMDWNPASPDYGKQAVEVILGQVGAGIPPFPGNSGNYRRLPLWAIKMPAGQSIYDSSPAGLYDLRRWDVQPATTTQGNLVTYAPPGGAYETIANWVNAGINTNLAAAPFTLPSSTAWDGAGTFSVEVYHADTQTQLPGPFVAWIWTETQDEKGEWKLNDYVVKPSNAAPVAGATPSTALAWQRHAFLGGVPPVGMAMLIPLSIPFVMRRIPSFYADAVSGGGRSWNKLRFRVMVGSLNGYLYIKHQELTAQFAPVV